MFLTPVLKSLHWLKVNERIKYKFLSLTYKVLTTNQPQYLHKLISVQPCHNTRSSSMVTIARPPTRSSLKITNRSFQYMLHLTYRTNSPLIFTSLVRHSLLYFHLSHMAVHHHLLHHFTITTSIFFTRSVFLSLWTQVGFWAHFGLISFHFIRPPDVVGTP